MGWRDERVWGVGDSVGGWVCRGGGGGGKSMWQAEMITTELTTDPNGKHAVYLCNYSTKTETETPGSLVGGWGELDS